jgi:SAM-dependent methyltransferase
MDLGTNTIERASPTRGNGTAEPAADSKTPEAFAGRVIGDFTGLATSLMAAVGDRLGLFKTLVTDGPATSAELAGRARIHERYAREWLSVMATARYLDYDAAACRFTLPAAHVPLLADEGGPMFFGGGYQQWLSLVRVLDDVSRAFRTGGGVPYDAYSQDFWEGTERFTVGWFDHLLVQQWLPTVPEVRAALERGALMADVGCGHGRALIRLAQAFPASRFVGYDVHAPSVARASAAAEAAGVADCVRFEQRDAAAGLPEQYDVITAFDMVHDVVAPRALLGAIRNALRPSGTFLCLDFNTNERLEDEIGNPLATLGYAVSIMFCMTTSLAHGGEGLGARGLHERKLRELCAEMGFGGVRRAAIENPLNVLYIITA